MPYTAEISRTQPTAFVFLIDQSGSMSDKMSSGRTKAQFVADALNRTLMNLITRCTKSDGTRDYFHVGVIGYGDNVAQNGFKGELSNKIINPISKIEANPLRVEDRTKKVEDGAGGITEQKIKFPIWLEPIANGGTPMCAALTKIVEEIVLWCDANPHTYPPTVLHITDGEATDGDPEFIAEQFKQISTKDGQALLLNIHVSTIVDEAIRFPASEVALPDQFAKMLFKMSSQLPEHLVRFAREKGHQVTHESKGFMFNAEAPEIVDFFDIGTRASQLR
jgi:hypothetical protein